MAYKQSPFSFYDGDRKNKKIEKVSKKLTEAENKRNVDPSKANTKKENRLAKKYDRLTEGSLVRQSLRRKF